MTRNTTSKKTLIVFCLSAVFLVTGCATNFTQKVSVERITPEQLTKLLPQPVANLSLEEVVKLSQQASNADEIIQKISTSNSRYELTPSQTLELSKQGVSAKVLDYIHTSNEAAKQNAMADEINKREIAKQQELEAAKLRLRQEQNLYYDPFWGGYGYRPFGYGFYGGYPYSYYPYGRLRPHFRH
ncbi:MAG: hypothetical protein H7Z18_00315 [Methylophilaceae bacterium]|nr:hypothetical protein [Methylophilaceae bacterium]